MKQVMFALALALVLAGSALGVPSVLAHAKLDHCTPAVGSTVAQAPAQVVCVMSEEIDTKLSTMSVLDGTGNPMDKQDAHVDLNDPDHKTLVVSLDPAQVKNGIYTVKWHTVTPDDGGITDGAFQFIVGSAAVTPFPVTQVSQDSTATAATSEATSAPAATSQPATAIATAAPSATNTPPATAVGTPASVLPVSGGSPASGAWVLGLLGLLVVLGGLAIRRLARS